jgi:alcohol dehydrogenase class IV
MLGAGHTANALPAWLAELARDLAIPGLHSYGLSSAMIAELAERALHASSTRSNPVELTASELGEAIRMAR